MEVKWKIEILISHLEVCLEERGHYYESKITTVQKTLMTFS